MEPNKTELSFTIISTLGHGHFLNDLRGVIPLSFLNGFDLRSETQWKDTRSVRLVHSLYYTL